MIKNYIIIAALLALGALLASHELSVFWSAPIAFFTGLLFSYQSKLPKLAVDQSLEKAQRDAAMRKGHYGFKLL